jgi:hypothetical protein
MTSLPKCEINVARTGRGIVKPRIVVGVGSAPLAGSRLSSIDCARLATRGDTS